MMLSSDSNMLSDGIQFFGFKTSWDNLVKFKITRNWIADREQRNHQKSGKQERGIMLSAAQQIYQDSNQKRYLFIKYEEKLEFERLISIDIRKGTFINPKIKGTFF